jgi:hypothetical protein
MMAEPDTERPSRGNYGVDTTPAHGGTMDTRSGQPFGSGLRRARAVKARFGAQLLAKPNVHTIGIGYKQRGGKDTGEIAIVVHVHRKLPPDQLAGHVIPPELSVFADHEGASVTVQTDIQQVPPPVPMGHVTEDLTAKVRPVPGGYSGGALGNDGTIGGWVWDRVEKTTVLLSNRHVITGTPGAIVIQPSAYDGGTPAADALAQVVRAGSTYDASIAKAYSSADRLSEIVGSGPAVLEIADPELGMLVEKTGRSTRHTLGKITVIDSEFVPPGGVPADTFVGPDAPGHFVVSGDSGSLLLERTHPEGRPWKRVVGLIWGGAPTEGGNSAWVHPIRRVFDELQLGTLCTGLIESLLGGRIR